MPRPPASERAPEAYRELRRGVDFLVRQFFRRLEVSGVENVPTDRGGILVAWHPNGLVDGAVILSTFPRVVVFGARSGLFRIPLLGRFARAVGTVPIYRRMDAGAEGVDELRRRNEPSLDALADRVASGSFSALFPEGFSHDAPYLQEVKSGAARLYYRARTRTPPGRPAPVVIPVGLHYDQKRLFRSSALVVFHPPMALPPELDVSPAEDEDPERVRELARGLTRSIDAELRSAILETESWETHQLMHRARKLLRSERALRAAASPGAATMDEKTLGMARIWVGYGERRKTHPREVASLRRRIHRYDAHLRALRLEDHELDRPPPFLHPGAWLGLVLQMVSVFVLLPPLLVAGAVIDLPTAGVVTAASRLVGREQKDFATLKLMGGGLLFPVTWGAWAWEAARHVDAIRTAAPWLPGSPALAAVATIVLGMAGAVVVLRYFEMAAGTLRALRVRFTRGVRSRALVRLKKERARLFDELVALSAGLDLPGVVHADGHVARQG
jgi:glycerol-3-phosphate O-acyltransferase / dihydroxyacetone phosphate acyltransferase